MYCSATLCFQGSILLPCLATCASQHMKMGAPLQQTRGICCSILVLLAQAKAACVIYVASLTVLFTASALYHRRTWTPSARLFMKRVDHAAIFVLIAGARPVQGC